MTTGRPVVARPTVVAAARTAAAVVLMAATAALIGVQLDNAVLTALNGDRLTGDERLGDLTPGALYNSPHGLARDPHGGGGLLVTQPLSVHQADGLELVEGDHELFELLCGDASGQKVDRGNAPTQRLIRGRGMATLLRF